MKKVQRGTGMTNSMLCIYLNKEVENLFPKNDVALAPIPDGPCIFHGCREEGKRLTYFKAYGQMGLVRQGERCPKE